MDPNQPQNQPQPEVQPPQTVVPPAPQPVPPQPVYQQPVPQAPAPGQGYAQPYAQPYGQPAAASNNNPGMIFGIISIVLSFIGLGLVGLILGIVGLRKSKKVGQGNVPAVIGIVFSVISIIVGILFLAGVIFGVGSVVKECNKLGPGTHVVNGTTYTCGSDATTDTSSSSDLPQ